MREMVPSNMNYNIAYCFFFPAVLYYSFILVHDIGSSWLLLLSLLSFTSVFKPNRHKILHVVIAESTVIDLVVKMLIGLGVLNLRDSFWTDTKVINNMTHLGTEVIEVRSLIYVLVIILSWILVFTYNIKSKTKLQTI